MYNAFIYNATLLKDSYNAHFWDEAQGMYRDNATTTLTPQDANSMAVLFNLTDSDTKKKRISDGLRKAWNNLGPVPPELPDTISPFISGIEVRATFDLFLHCVDPIESCSFKHISRQATMRGRLILCIEPGDTCSTPTSASKARFSRVSPPTGLLRKSCLFIGSSY